MDNGKRKEDYRQFIISKWATTQIESFRQPTLLDFENQSRYFKSLIEQFVPNRKDIDILEIGCGWGGFVYTLKKEGYSKIDAIDVIPECCAFVEHQLGVKATCIDVFKFFNENKKKYDMIIAFDVLEHFKKDEILSLVLSIYETLNNKGVFMMKSPNGGSLRGLYIRYSGFTHEIAFTPLSINELFRTVGFGKISCIPEPESDSNLVKVWVKKLARKFVGRLLSLDPNFINSANIIGVGIKSDKG